MGGGLSRAPEKGSATMNSKIIIFGLAATLGVSVAQSQEIATWAGFRGGVATFTFDDGLANQLSIAVPIFDKYGYKASFYPVINWGPNWSAYQTLVNQGYEVGSHSMSHAQTMPDSEIKSSKDAIDAKITGQTCNTITYPNCNVPSESELSKYYIGGRICSGQIDPKTPSNYNRISSIICGNTGSVNTAQAFEQKMQLAVSQSGWVTFLIHEVDNGSGYSPTASTAIDGALSWAKQNDSKIWVTTFRNAIMYSKERDASKIEQASRTTDKVTYTLKHSLSTTVSAFNYPLSIRVKNSDNWTTVTATQNKKAITATIADGYIYFDAVPNGGDIELSSGSVAATYKITTTSSAVTLSATTAKEGDNVTFTVKADDGYEITRILVNNEALTLSGGSYSFTMPAADISIAVEQQRTTALDARIAAGGVQVSVQGAGLMIEGAAGKRVTVFNLLGNIVRQVNVSSDNEAITGEAAGTYLVKIDDRTWSVRF